MRKEKLITPHKELELIEILGNQLLEAGYHAGNSIIITVSTDYSATVGQVIRHRLSHKGEICYGFGIDVPYPDETWDRNYIAELSNNFKNYAYLLQDKTAILVQAGVIRGGNYKYLTEWIRENYGTKLQIVTVAMLENIGSQFKSDIVAEYYNDTIEDLTFWWETENKHWNN